MRKLYALFKSEEEAQSAIDKITDCDPDIKIELFADNFGSAEEDIFLSDAHVIGSPSGMATQFHYHDGEQLQNTTHQAGLSAFCYADFVATGKNSLIESEKERLNIPTDIYGAGLVVKTPSSKRDFIMTILADEGAKLID